MSINEEIVKTMVFFRDQVTTVAKDNSALIQGNSYLRANLHCEQERTAVLKKGLSEVERLFATMNGGKVYHAQQHTGYIVDKSTFDDLGRVLAELRNEIYDE